MWIFESKDQKILSKNVVFSFEIFIVVLRWFLDCQKKWYFHHDNSHIDKTVSVYWTLIQII